MTLVLICSVVWIVWCSRISYIILIHFLPNSHTCVLSQFIFTYVTVVNKKLQKRQKLHLDISIQSVTYSPLRTQCLLILLLRKIVTSKTLYFYDVMFTTLEITLTMTNLNFKSSWTCEIECCVTMTKSDVCFAYSPLRSENLKKEH